MKLVLTEVYGEKRIAISIDVLAKMYSLRPPVSATFVYEDTPEFVDSLDERLVAD